MKVSIITAAYNSENTIHDTIESVCRQKYKNIEYIIIDGKSKDKTVKIVEDYQDLFLQKKIDYKWISEKDSGIYEAINKGINLSTGDIIGILNSDDYYKDDNVIGIIVNTFSNNSIDCCYGNLEFINPISKKVSRKWISKPFKSGMFEKSWTPAHPTFYCKKEIYVKFGLYRTDFKIASDVELMFRFLEKNKIKFKYINTNLIVMRQGGISNNSIKSTYTIIKEMRKAFLENGIKINLAKYLLFKILKFKEFI